MVDVEKLRNGLEYCQGIDICCDFEMDKECPYGETECVGKMKEDMLSLLKEFEPRTLSLEELKTYIGEAVWFVDYGDGCSMKSKDDLYSIARPAVVEHFDDDLNWMWFRLYGCNAQQKRRYKEYGKAWVCWNRKPK